MIWKSKKIVRKMILFMTLQYIIESTTLCLGPYTVSWMLLFWASYFFVLQFSTLHFVFLVGVPLMIIAKN